MKLLILVIIGIISHQAFGGGRKQSLRTLHSGEVFLEETWESLPPVTGETRGEAGDLESTLLEEMLLHGLNSWKSVGRGAFLLEGEANEEQCSEDHVKAEDRMDSEFPLGELPSADSSDLTECSASYYWLEAADLESLTALLASQSDFIRLQLCCFSRVHQMLVDKGSFKKSVERRHLARDVGVEECVLDRVREDQEVSIRRIPGEVGISTRKALCSMRDWMVKGIVREFKSSHKVMKALVDVFFKSQNAGVRRLSSCLIAFLLKNYDVAREQLTKDDNGRLMRELLSVVTDASLKYGKIPRRILTSSIVATSKRNLDFTDFLIRHFDWEMLFRSINLSDDDIFRLDLFRLIRNVLEHPLGFDTITTLTDFECIPFIGCLSSLIPVVHCTAFETLSILLRISRNPQQEIIHTDFIKNKGILVLLYLLEETFLVYPKMALYTLTLMDDLADSDKGQNFLICTGFNILRSLVFYDNESGRATIRTSGQTTTKTDKTHTLLPDGIGQIISESKRIDKYNSINAQSLPNLNLYDYDFFDEDVSGGRSVYLPERKTFTSTHPKKKTEFKKNVSVRLSIGARKIPAFEELINRRLEYRHEKPYTLNHTDVATHILSHDLSPSAEKSIVDNNLKLMAMEILSKLATYKPRTRLVLELVRSVCPLLRNYKDREIAAESSGYCLKLLIYAGSILEGQDDPLADLLTRYYLVRELANGLELVTDDIAKGSILAALATLLNSSTSSLYLFSRFKIRNHLFYWLKQSPSLTFARTCLDNLKIIYYLSRKYKCRDYIMSKTMITQLFRIIQDNNTEELSKIYGISSLAFLTLANKRYRQIGFKKRYSIFNEDDPRTESTPDGFGDNPYGPFPVEDSFQQLEDLKVLGGNGVGLSPVLYFETFLLGLLLERSTAYWSGLLLKKHEHIFQGMSDSCGRISWLEDLERKILDQVPTLSFYHRGMVSPWVKLDEEDFFVCADFKHPQEFGCFLKNKDQVTLLSPLCVSYKLSKNEQLDQTPWDIYWKECYTSPIKDTTVPKFCPSVRSESIFGFGGIKNSNEKEVIIVFSPQIKELRPKNTDKIYFYHLREDKNDKRNFESTFKYETLPKMEPISWECNRILSAKQVLLPHLYRHQMNLFYGRQKYKQKNKDVLKFDSKLTNLSELQLRFNEISNFPKVIEFNKTRLRNYSFYLFKCIVNSLKNPPELWIQFINNKISSVVDKRVLKMELFLKIYPNLLLKHMDKLPLFLSSKIKCQRILRKVSPYQEAFSVVSTMILEAMEKMSEKSIGVITKPINWRYAEESGRIMWSEDRKLPDISGWQSELTYGGRLLLHLIDKPFSEKTWICLLKYDISLGPRSRKSSASSPGRQRPSQRSGGSRVKHLRDGQSKGVGSIEDERTSSTESSIRLIAKEGQDKVSKNETQRRSMESAHFRPNPTQNLECPIESEINFSKDEMPYDSVSRSSSTESSTSMSLTEGQDKRTEDGTQKRDIGCGYNRPKSRETPIKSDDKYSRNESWSQSSSMGSLLYTGQISDSDPCHGSKSRGSCISLNEEARDKNIYRPSGDMMSSNSSSKSNASLKSLIIRDSKNICDGTRKNIFPSQMVESDGGSIKIRFHTDSKKVAGGSTSSSGQSLSPEDLYLPTTSELISDLFFQPHNIEYRGFHFAPIPDGSLHSLTSHSTDMPLNPVEMERHRSEVMRQTLDIKYSLDYQKPLQNLGQDFERRESEISGTLHNPDFKIFCQSIKNGVQNILKSSEMTCWYSEILKFLAKSVCSRLEGPWDQVDGYLMCHHRKELRRLLGTSVIPFGRLRIGGSLERAILFKFLADQLDIPCGLRRQGESSARVELPRHPFLFPQRGLLTIDLDKNPGELKDLQTDLLSGAGGKCKSSLSAIERALETASDLNSRQEQSFQECDTDSLDKLLSLIRRKDSLRQERMKKNLREYASQDSPLPSIFTMDSEIFQTKLPTGGHTFAAGSGRCSLPLSEEHFKDTEVQETGSLCQEELRTSSIPRNDDDANIDESHKSSLLLNVPDETLLKFTWKPDPADRYSMIIGKIGEESFVTCYNQTTTSQSQEQKYDELSSEILNFTYYTETKVSTILKNMSKAKRSIEMTIKLPSTKKLEIEEETEEYFKKWEEIIRKIHENIPDRY